MSEWRPSIGEILSGLAALGALFGVGARLRLVRIRPRQWLIALGRFWDREFYMIKLEGRVEYLEAETASKDRQIVALTDRINSLVDQLPAVLPPGSLDDLPPAPAIPTPTTPSLPGRITRPASLMPPSKSP